MIPAASSCISSDRYRIVPGHPGHIAALAARMRIGDSHELHALGMTAQEGARISLRESLYARTVFVDGEMAAMFGLGGSFISRDGQPWLLTTPAIERVPFAFARVGRQLVAEMLTHKPFLWNYVTAEYHAAVRLLEILGFTVDDPRPFGPAGVPFRRFWKEA